MKTKLTLAQTETLEALAYLGRKQLHSVLAVVKARTKVRPGNHKGHFKKHVKLMTTKTERKLEELKEKGVVKAGKLSGKNSDGGLGWMITVKGEKLIKEML